ncbi:MAG: hypothetical protein KTR23_18365 [Rhodospirillales bacterium]|nr:hypothetical protein [Rhodospirillales bacterium]
MDKEKELCQVSRFLDFFLPKNSPVCVGEMPDFMVNINNYGVGIEVTEFHTFDGSSDHNEIRKEKRRKSFLRFIEKELNESNVPINVCITFNENAHDFPKQKALDVAQLIKNQCQEKTEGINGDIPRDMLDETIVTNIHLTPDNQMNVQHIQGYDIDPTLNIPRLNETIKKKTEDFKNPNFEKFHKNHLVVVFDYVDPSSNQSLRIDSETTSRIKFEEFDSVFLYRTYHSKIVQINNNRPLLEYAKGESKLIDVLIGN